MSWVKKSSEEDWAQEAVLESGEEKQAPDIQEDDYVITTGGPLGSLYAVNKLGFSSPEMHEVMWAIAKDIEKTKFFPNIWFINDHGNTELLALDILDNDLTLRVVQSWV